MPWPGFFHKMAIADRYIFLDDVQFRKNYFHNRNRLVNTHGDIFWLTVPLKSGQLSQKINEKVILDTEWKIKYLRNISQAYCKAKFYEKYYPELEQIVIQCDTSLLNFNLSLIEWLRKSLDINTPIGFSSDLDLKCRKSDLILEICCLLEADKYLSGPSGIEYLDVNSFYRKGIDVFFHKFEPPAYQSNGTIISGLSTLDLLMVYGPSSMEIVNNAQRDKGLK
jgi:hypothetical protein